MLSNRTSQLQISWVFKELSPIISKISYSGRSHIQWKINRFVYNENFWIITPSHILWQKIRLLIIFEEICAKFSRLLNLVVARPENRRFFENNSFFFSGRYMFLCLACRVKQLLSNATSLIKISWFFKALWTIISKISCSVGKFRENRRFFENNRLFYNERYIFLCFTCRVKRMLSNATCFARIRWVFIELSTIISKISCSGSFEFREKTIVFSENF